MQGGLKLLLKTICFIYFFYLSFFLTVSQANGKISESLHYVLRKDTVCNIWIYFTDKGMVSGSSDPACSRALARRKAAGYISSDNMDLPLREDYIRSVETLGGKLRHAYKWENAASFSVSSRKIKAISRLPFIKSIEPVGVYRRKERKSGKYLEKKAADRDSIYGLSFGQLNMASITSAHEYLNKFKNKAAPGSGVLMAFFDSGFRLDHRCFNHVSDNNSIKATRDFIDNDNTVFDPDSVCSDTAHPYYTNDHHGTSTLSLVAGYDPGNFMGAAWGAQFVLARTEDTYSEGYMEREIHAEEDNWVAALVWAESLGVDIVSSSLGYRDGFEDSVIIWRDGKYDTIGDYSYSDLDGETAIVSRAASMAIRRGVLIVTAVGNEGSSESGTLCAPADAYGVIAVGSVDSDRHITWFSSTGPTYDGRIKPDLVTLGTNIAVAVTNRSAFSEYGRFGTGTSFSTPFISGICALIRQTHPVLEPSQVRSRLYRYCHLLPDQDTIDNKYGRGLPNAVLSCMQDDEIFVKIRDSSGIAIRHVLIENQSGDSLGITDHEGAGLIKEANLPVSIGLVFSGKRYTLSIDSTPAYREIIIDDDSGGVIVSLRNKQNQDVAGTVFMRFEGEQKYLEQNTDESGNIRIGHYKEITAEIFAKAPGYKTSDTISVLVCSRQCSEVIFLEEIPVSQFHLYPTVIKKDMSLKVKFLSKIGKSQSHIRLSVRSVDGALVWKENRFMEPAEPFEFEWDCRNAGRGKRIVPGVYFLIIECNGKVYRKKFLISG